jgi:hypothetical protein
VVVKYTRPTFSAKLEASSFLQRQEGVEDTTRNSMAFSYTRTRGNRQFLMGEASAMQNRALGYDLRAGLTGAFGRYLVRNQGSELVVASGLYVDREVPVEGETVTNLEALVAADWAIFSYDFPKTDIEFSTVLIFGLTDWGRYRVDLNARFDRELFDDFSLVVKGFYNYDSKPPTAGASRDDYLSRPGLLVLTGLCGQETVQHPVRRIEWEFIDWNFRRGFPGGECLASRAADLTTSLHHPPQAVQAGEGHLRSAQAAPPPRALRRRVCRS